MVKTDLGNDVPEKIHYVVDARGSACPGPLLEAKKAIAKVNIGEILEVQSSDIGTQTDLPAWADFMGHEYLGLVEEAGYARLFIIRKK
ncbi:MAG: sulfurtransferase TusA family protein [Promethearchaeota archaeon]